MIEPIYENQWIKLYQGDCLEIMPNLDVKFDCCITDPPYWKVINETWDYQWRTEQDYIEWCKPWLKEVYRTLRYGGSFYLFGYFRMLAMLILNLKEYGFDLRQQIIINKGLRAVSGRATKNYRMFPNVTESVLFLTKDNICYSRDLLKSRQKELKLTSKEINDVLGVKSNGGGMWSIYTGKNVCKQFPTREMWESLQKILKFSIPYDSIAQTFNAEMGVTDVWDDIDFYSEKRFHPTQKPLKLISRLVLASSNCNNFIIDPFAGSGTTGVSCMETNRKCVLIEKDEKYCEITIKRLQDKEKEIAERLF